MDYTAVIKFDGEKHCLRCPLRNKSDDSCNLQSESDDFENWNEQLANCPLIEK